jgi:hypothetical protein
VVVLGQSGLKDRSPVKIVDPVMPSEDDTEEES